MAQHSTFIPPKMINLRLILPEQGESSKAHDFIFSPKNSAAEIAQHVFDNWPEDWAGYEVPRPEILRLIFQGRFLHENVTLGVLKLPLGKTTVMHLVPRERLPQVNSQENRSRSKDRSGAYCRCLGTCTIV